MKQLCRFLSLILLLLSFAPGPSFSEESLAEGSPAKETSAKNNSTKGSSSTATSSSANTLSAHTELKGKPSKQLVDLLEKLAINQGKGQFVQQKHFSFMSVPITSTGHFVVKDESALWQTQQPVFSALLLTPDAIYRRLSLDDDYELLTDSAEFSAILSTIFTGKVKTDDWLLNSRENDTCLELTPKAGQLKQLFRQVDLCLVNESNRPAQQRQITLTDNKGDKTVINMMLSQDAFSADDLEALKRSASQDGTVNDS